MKVLVLTAFFAAIVFAVRADSDLIRNGDFSGGINHWEGDLHTADSSSFADGETPPTSGVVVKLHHGSWSQVIQDITGKVGEYKVSITYSTSTDLKFSTRAEDYQNVPGQLGYAIMPFSSEPGKWNLIIIDRAAGHYNYWKIPATSGTGAQTVNFGVQLDTGDDATKGFILIFPPGDGFINLQKVSMKPAGA
jgi:hypothetical protein